MVHNIKMIELPHEPLNTGHSELSAVICGHNKNSGVF